MTHAVGAQDAGGVTSSGRCDLRRDCEIFALKVRAIVIPRFR
jgi:hypothetical protein